MSFVLRGATVVVDTPEEAHHVTSRLNMKAALLGDVLQGVTRLEGQALVVSAQQPHAKTVELVARGISNADVRYVDMAGEYPLPVMATSQLDRLRWLFQQPLSVKGDRVRLLSQWPTQQAWQPWQFNDGAFNEFLRWRPRNLAVIVGDEGSGKSTFSQVMAMKLLTGDPLWGRHLRASVCAWEDDRENFRDMVTRFSTVLESRIFWFEPDADPERLLDEYLTNIEYLAKHEGCVLHIADPWNAFQHDAGSDIETRYVQRMLLEMQKLTRALDITIIVVTHLPKRPGRGLRPFGLADAAGSKEFANKADMGFCVSNTGLLADIPSMTEEQLKVLRITPEQVSKATGGRPVIGTEHMLIAVDKVKIRGMTGRGMGERVLRAFVFDRENCALTLDPVATEIARLVWS